MALTDTTVKNAKPKEKDYKLTDEKGMYLFIATSGGVILPFLGALTSRA